MKAAELAELNDAELGWDGAGQRDATPDEVGIGGRAAGLNGAITRRGRCVRR